LFVDYPKGGNVVSAKFVFPKASLAETPLFVKATVNLSRIVWKNTQPGIEKSIIPR